jgi:hypothetical protein
MWMRLQVFLLLAALAGCAGGVDSAPAVAPVNVVACHDRAECNRYWQRARQWVTDNSYYPIRQSTDWVILTPSPADFGLHPSFSVVKTPNAEGGATIGLQVTCAVYLPCIPTRGTLVERFNAFVAAQ